MASPRRSWAIAASASRPAAGTAHAADPPDGGIEDIPNAVLTEGIPWNWESYPDYLGALAAAALRHRYRRISAACRAQGLMRWASAPPITRPRPRTTWRAWRRPGARGGGGRGVRGRHVRTIFHRFERRTVGADAARQRGRAHHAGTAVKAAGHGVLQYAVDWEDAEATFALIRRVAERSGCPSPFPWSRPTAFRTIGARCWN